MFLRTSTLLLFLLTGCAVTRPQTTRMTVDDLNEMAAQMAQSLAADEDFRSRTPQSEPWVISINKALNLSTDIITEGERWFVVQKLRSSLPIQALSKQKNVTFVIPAERMAMMKRDPRFGVKDEAGFGEERKPTHTMTATFRGSERATALARTDSYYCEFEILNLSTGEPAWTDKFEYKRAAVGHIWD
jgi:hypothetical protein